MSYLECCLGIIIVMMKRLRIIICSGDLVEPRLVWAMPRLRQCQGVIPDREIVDRRWILTIAYVIWTSNTRLDAVPDALRADNLGYLRSKSSLGLAPGLREHVRTSSPCRHTMSLIPAVIASRACVVTSDWRMDVLSLGKDGLQVETLGRWNVRERWWTACAVSRKMRRLRTISPFAAFPILEYYFAQAIRSNRGALVLNRTAWKEFVKHTNTNAIPVNPCRATGPDQPWEWWWQQTRLSFFPPSIRTPSRIKCRIACLEDWTLVFVPEFVRLVDF